MVIRILHAERDRNKNKNFRRMRVEAVEVRSKLYSSAQRLPGVWSQPYLAAIQGLPYQQCDLG